MSGNYGGLSVEDYDESHVQSERVQHELGLGGCEYLLPYPTKEALAKAARHLIMDSHGHHFAITREGTALALSGMALDCLTTASLLP